MRKRRFFALLLACVGSLLFSVPFSLSVWNDWNSQRLVNSWSGYLARFTEEEKAQWNKQAEEYRRMADTGGQKSVVDPFSQHALPMKNPFSGFDVSDPVGVVHIPSLDLHMRLYLSATEENLEKGAAVIDGTDLPLGGKGRRSVIAGHRGWYGPVYFLHLDQLEAGDRIILEVLNQTLVYEVKDKEVIAPYETEKLAPKKEEDIITLLTCDPYPLFTDRLLVNAVRTESPREEPSESASEVVSDEIKSEPQLAVHETVHGGIVFRRVLFIALSLLGIAALVFSAVLAYREWRKRQG